MMVELHQDVSCVLIPNDTITHCQLFFECAVSVRSAPTMCQLQTIKT